MGRIAEALRANLRELAQADARMWRDLDGALPLDRDPIVGGALADGIDKLGVKELKALCKERGFKGYTGLNKAGLIEKIRGGEPSLTAKAPAKVVAQTPGLAAIEARLDRMEALLLRIAERVGVSDPGFDAGG